MEAPEEGSRPAFFHGWWLVVLVAVVMVVHELPFHSALGPWSLAMKEEFNWQTFTLLAAVFAIGGGVSLFLGPVVGYLCDRVIPIRRMVIAGLIVLAGGFFLFSLVESPVIYLLASTIMIVGATMSGWILLMTVLCRWFVRRRTLVIAVAHLFAGFAPVLFPVTFVLSLSVFGWRLSSALVGVLVVAVALAVVAWLRNRPEDMGLLPDGDLQESLQPGFSAREALQTRTFWFIALADGLAHIEVYDLSDSTLALVLLTIFSLAFLLVGGVVGDRFSKSAVLASFATLQIVAWAALSFVGNNAGLYIAAVFIGMSYGGITPIRVAIVADYFGARSLATIFGLFAMFSGGTGFLVGLLIGSLYAAQGNTTGFLILSGLTVLAVFSFLRARPPQPPETPPSPPTQQCHTP